MKLTRSYLKQLIREVIQKEGLGDWLDRMRAADEESAAGYREKVAAREEEDEEDEEDEEKKEFFGSSLGKGLEKTLREEEEEIKDLSERRRKR